ncbi:ISL3 family transposase [Halobacillus amylolyticus]|uniref:ISL3 family transposase n=1 Tax=Halobacillus amylolyticus TaxID=2932259 RepID=A0ABY4HFT4_9BACI|nr:ISL3 family transposase [Halobacillus amylolyticus]UOR13604.1 ISL3 family transposase [Halobacillus amylolyticus]
MYGNFFCDTASCEQHIFTERDIGLLEPYARRTSRMDKTLRSMAFSTSAEQGSRLSKQIDVPVSADTLLRLIRKTPLHPSSPSDAVGIDEWAYLKRHRYGVLICDLQTRRPIALLEEFSADAVRQWLEEHKNIKVVSRDGSLKFKQAIQESNHNIIQVTDRWHLVHNFNERIERILPQIVDSRIPIPKADSQPNQEHQSHSFQTERGTQKEQLMDQVKALGNQGFSYTSVAELLRIDSRTAKKYMHTIEPPMQGKRKRQSMLDPYRSRIQASVQPGVTAKEVYEDLVSKGYKGSFSLVSHYIADIRKQKRKGHSNKLYLSRKRLHQWLWKPYQEVKKRTKWLFLNDLCRKHPELQQLYEQIQTFQVMIQHRMSDYLPVWLSKAEQSPFIEMKRFAKRIRTDYEAIQNALSYEWNNGVLEGQINRLKTIKRLMYGRANFDLIKKRVLYQAL